MIRAALAIALVLAAAAVGANSLTRLRHFTPDSMVYVDVARNLGAGRGVGYSTLLLNDPNLPLERSFPVPLTTFPPLYPLAIAGVAHLPLGLAEPEAALAIAAACWLAIVLLGYALARRAWGETAGRLAAALLLVYAPLHVAGTTAWSEPLGVALILGSMLALPRADRGSAWRALVSGLLGGLAFATRYALAPWLPLAPLLLLARGRRGVAPAFAWGAAALVPAAIVLLRNHQIDGEFMPSAGPSTVPFLVNLGAAFRVLTGNVMAERAWAVQAAIGGIVLLVALGAAWRRDRSVLAGDAAVPVAWVVGYVVFLVVESTLREFDPIDGRLMLPAGVVAVLVVAGVLARGVRPPAWVATLAVMAALGWVAVREGRIFRAVDPTTTAAEVAAVPRYAWLARHTGPRDLLIGDNMRDVVFYAQRNAISYEDWPGTVPPDPARLRAWYALHRREFARAWIVLNDRWPHARDWGRRYGPFFGRLASGRDTSDAGVGKAVMLPDAIVYPYDPTARPR